MDAIPGDGPFIMMPDGLAHLYSASGLLDAPLPTHYEPLESPVRNELYPSVGANPMAITWVRPENPLVEPDDPRWPHVASTFRLTEHHTAGPMSRNLPWLAELQPEMFAEIDPVLAASAGIEDGDWMVIESPRAEIEARAKVTNRVRPLRIGDRVVHQVCLPWHFGTYASTEQGVVGDAANDLVAISGDPNVSIHESKAFRCSVRAGRREEETTERLAGVDSTPEDAAPDETHPAEQPDRGAQTEQSVLPLRRTGREPGDLMAAAPTEIAIHSASRRAGWGSSRTRPPASAARPARSPASSGTTCPPTSSGSARGAPTTTRARCRRRAGGTCASSRRASKRPRKRSSRRAPAATCRRSPPRRPTRRSPTTWSTWWAWRRVVPALDRWVFMSDVCKHCTNAGCLDACPTGALIRTEFQTVIVQPDICNGCGYCVPSCPFGVINRDPYDGRAAKCTLCYDRLEDGLEPACAKACPTDSIQFGPYDELVERAQGRVRGAARARDRERVPVRRRRRAGRAARRQPGRVLPAHRAAGALRPAGAGRLADPGEHADRHCSGPGGGRGRRAR